MKGTLSFCFFLLTLVGGFVSATSPLAASEMPEEITNRYCPITGDTNYESTLFFEYEGQKVFLCCQRCVSMFAKNPQKYLPRLEAVLIQQKQEDEAHQELAKKELNPKGLLTPSQLLGRFHVVLIHFPIALIFVLAFLELKFFFSGANESAEESSPDTYNWMLFIAMLGGVISVLTGWFAAGEFTSTGQMAEVLELHRWLGFAVAISTVGLWVLNLKVGSTGVYRDLYRMLIVALAILVGTTAHYGGKLVHGLDYLPF